MPSNDPIPAYEPDPDRTVAANARMAIAALGQATDGETVAQADAADVVARRVPGGGRRQATAALERLEAEGVVESRVDAARFMGGEA